MRAIGPIVRAAEQVGWTAVTFVGTNIGVMFLSAEHFGMLAIASSIILIGQALARTQLAEPQAVAVVQGEVQLPALYRVGARGYLRTVAPMAGALALVVALLVPAPWRLLTGATLLALVALPVADLTRGALLVSGRARRSVLAATIGLVLQSVVTVGAFSLLPGPAAFPLGWGTGLVVYTVIGSVALRTTVVVGRSAREKETLDQVRSRARWPFLIEATLGVGTSQGATLLLALVLGPTASGAIRAAFLLFFPVNMAVQSASQSLVPQVAPYLHTRRGQRRLLMLTLAGLGGVIVYSMLLYWVSPVVAHLLRDSFESAYDVLTGVALHLAGTVTLLVPLAASRAAGRLRYGAVLRAVQAPWLLLGPTLMAILGGSLSWVAVAYAIGGTMSIVGGLVVLRLLRSLLDYQPETTTS